MAKYPLYKLPAHDVPKAILDAVKRNVDANGRHHSGAEAIAHAVWVSLLHHGAPEWDSGGYVQLTVPVEEPEGVSR